MTLRKQLLLWSVITFVLMAVFMFYHLEGELSYVLPRRGYSLLAIILTSIAVAFSSIIFQTITNNRLLTPNIIGIDSIYLFIQTLVVYFISFNSWAVKHPEVKFLLSLATMMAFSVVIFKLLFRNSQSSVYVMLLIGIVIGTLFSSLTTFMSLLMNPEDFLAVQDKSFASFNQITAEYLIVIVPIIIICCLLLMRMFPQLTVLNIGDDESTNLGVNVFKVKQRAFILTCILTSAVTAFVGPIMFLGFFIAQVTYKLVPAFRQGQLILAGTMVSMVTLLICQLALDHIFEFSTAISVIINAVGGSYFLYLLIKERKVW